MRVSRFEDLSAWQKARILSKEIYIATRSASFARDKSLVWQIRDAAVSVMANLAEGFDRHGPAEFHRFVSIAHGSCSEVRSHLYVALDAGCISEEEFERLSNCAREADRVIRALRASLDRARSAESDGTRIRDEEPESD